MEQVAALDKVRGLRFDCKLDLAEDFIVELYVDEDVIGAWLQPVLYADDLHFFGVILADSLELFVDAHNLLFLGGALASHEITHFEGEEVDGWGPEGELSQLIIIVHLLGDFHESVD